MAERLANESSQYLRGAAGSPVDWYPWGAEAFERAKREDKPILLDIGAVWCHWCHVMDHGTYEDDEVVRRLQDDFVCVKVDRDERPDVDVRYQRAVGALTGQGGWPLTAFLTPEGQVFFGGTYFPVEDAHGRAGFRSVLTQIAQVYRDDRERVEHSAESITDALRRAAERTADEAPLTEGLLDEAGRALVKAHDAKFGGFGTAPKFPHTPAIGLAMALHQRTGDEQLLQLAERTLTKMAAGGIHDQVAGGFHRYSVDAHWTVPHFEKMAYDNAELLRVYAEGHARTGRPRYREVAEGILRWVLDECADREHGGFAASQDADIGPHDDGDFFTWTPTELREALTPRGDDPAEPDAETLYRIARLRYGVEERGDMHHNPAKNVLELDATVEEVADMTKTDVGTVQQAEAEILRRLGRARGERETPFVDPTRFTDWNAMYVSAFLEAASYLGHEEARRQALRTLDRLVAEHWEDGKGWLHRPREDGGLAVSGLLDDQVWMGLALIDGVVHGGRRDLLQRAIQTGDLLLEHFQAPEGGFYDTAAWVRENAEAAPLAEPDRPWLDQSGPGSNPMAARFLLRLARLAEAERFREAGERALRVFAGDAQRMGLFAASWFQTVEEALSDPPLVTVLGAPDDPETETLVAAARSAPRPGRLVLSVTPGETDAVPSYLQDIIGNEDLIKEGARAMICYGDRCEALLADADEVRTRIVRVAST